MTCEDIDRICRKLTSKLVRESWSSLERAYILCLLGTAVRHATDGEYGEALNIIEYVGDVMLALGECSREEILEIDAFIREGRLVAQA